MPITPRLVSFRKLIWCVLGSVAFMVGSTAYAEEVPSDFDIPAAPSESDDGKKLPDEPTATAEEESAKSAKKTSSTSHPSSRPLTEVRATIEPPSGILPKSRSVRDLDESIDILFDGPHRPWAYTSYQWEAPATRHLPLLFEEPNLERLGYAYGFCDCGICDEEPRRGQRLQALVSFVHFFGRVPFIPYMAGVHPLTEPYYTLGVDRPGSPVPYRKHLFHHSVRGSLYQAGAAVGAVFIIP